MTGKCWCDCEQKMMDPTMCGGCLVLLDNWAGCPPDVAETERLRKALEFYADRETYAPGVREYWGGETETTSPPIFQDMGNAARAALDTQRGENHDR